jgi:hypothetical protein
MYINTTKFNLGDQELGVEGWKLYWYKWIVYYFPLLIYGLTLNYIKNTKIKDLIKCNSVFTIFLIAVIEISFIFNLSWHFLIIEYVLVGIIWIYVLKLKMYLTRRFS